MSGVEGAERKDYDECEAGVGELQEHSTAQGAFRLRSGQAAVHEGNG